MRLPVQWIRLVSREVLFALLALVLVLGLGAVFPADGAFFTVGTHADTLWQNAAYGILACGMTVVILTGGIDLSVGSVVALSGVVFSILVMRDGMSGWVAIPAGIATGAACGLVSGLLVARARVQPFVATLAMMAFARGMAKWLAGGRVVTAYPYPELIELLNKQVSLLGVRVSINVFVFLAVTAVTLILLRVLTFGVRVYAVGDNEEAARRSGVPVARVKWIAYAFSGALAGLAGVLFAALVRQGNPDDGVGYELTAIAMVVIGGTALSGGRGGMVLTLLGVLTVGYLRKILDINNVETPMQLMITGGIIVLAVLVQGVRRR